MCCDILYIDWMIWIWIEEESNQKGFPIYCDRARLLWGRFSSDTTGRTRTAVRRLATAPYSVCGEAYKISKPKVDEAHQQVGCQDVSWCWWGGLNMSGSMDMSGHECDQANGSKKFKYIPMFEILYMMVAHIYWYSIWRDCFTFPLNSSQVVDFAWIYTSGARWRSVFWLLWVVLDSGPYAYIFLYTVNTLCNMYNIHIIRVHDIL